VALDLAHDGRHGVARECRPALDVVAVDRLDEPEARDLEEIVVGLSGVAVAGSEGVGQRQEPA
jgi:hypothetical protein